MIIGLKSTGVFDVIRRLQFHSQKYYLSGSRYFGYARPDSDWDFFSNDSPMEWLERHSFAKLKMNPNWYDDNTLCIYKHLVWDLQISIQRDVGLKCRAQEYILENEVMLKSLREGDMDMRTTIWNAAFNYVR